MGPTHIPTPLPTHVPTPLPTHVPTPLPTTAATVRKLLAGSPQYIVSLSYVIGFDGGIGSIKTKSASAASLATFLKALQKSFPAITAVDGPTFDNISPTGQPTGQPSGQPSARPTGQPSSRPTTQPTSQPTRIPTSPTGQPSSRPSSVPTAQPTSMPSQPTSQPTHRQRVPSYAPTAVAAIRVVQVTERNKP